MATNYGIQSFRQSHLRAPFRFDSTQSSFRQAFAFTTLQVARFGYTGQLTYQQHELVPLPRTVKDSSRVSIGYNVGGLLIGTDLKQEVVVISAHYDHLGKNGTRVFYGADDNASGTATVLPIASVFDSLARQGIC
ncbi:MAG: M28 family peptidase [Spirosoma sp.]|nr:M28 family peptidase [Spirosoma sp.]